MQNAALKKQFESVFGAESDATTGGIVEVQAPGRVNLIGEHTDYNDGLVCPMAIDKATSILFRKRKDNLIRMHSTVSNQTIEWTIDHKVPREGPTWALYPKGVTEALRIKKLLKIGFDALVASDVPIGGGLSSSASFEVATGFALLQANGTKMSLVDLALACQWAEHTYPGMPCGIMDQFISAMGEAGHAMLLDCRDQSVTQVPMDDPELRVVISNSNVKHELVQGEYTARRHQCEAAVKQLQKRFPKIKSLRDATLDELEDSRMGTDPTVYKRAKHVITEIQRTIDFGVAMAKRDYTAAGVLMYGSHDSLRDDYAVSCKELDVLVEIARQVPGVYGARMTGGGFGGCIVALTKSNAVTGLTKLIDTQYPKETGQRATTFSTVASAGVHLVK